VNSHANACTLSLANRENGSMKPARVSIGRRRRPPHRSSPKTLSYRRGGESQNGLPLTLIAALQDALHGLP